MSSAFREPVWGDETKRSIIEKTSLFISIDIKQKCLSVCLPVHHVWRGCGVAGEARRLVGETGRVDKKEGGNGEGDFTD